ncbi:MAG: hypothetical protein R3D03_05695 [Geminicoccaceae bacterium]
MSKTASNPIIRAASVLALGSTMILATPADAENSNDTFRYLKLFGEVYERVRAEYVEEVSDQELIESAINGMLTSLDPHSSYLDTSKYVTCRSRPRRVRWSRHRGHDGRWPGQGGLTHRRYTGGAPAWKPAI